MLNLMPRHQFDSLSQTHDSKRRQGALSRWSQFVSMPTCQLSGLNSLHDIETTMHSQRQHRYHLACGNISRASRAACQRNLGLPVLSRSVWQTLSRLHQPLTQARLWLKRKALLTGCLTGCPVCSN